MIETGIDKRVKINQIVQGQLPSYLVQESPKSVDFLKQYYLSQESQGGPTDLIDNLDQYLKFDNLTPEVLGSTTVLTENVSTSDSEIFVESTKGYPNNNGLFKINDEIIYYTGITTNSFTGCVRGFSGITDYSSGELIFSSTSSAAHNTGSTVTNLSVLFLKEFFRNLKILFAPGFEDESLVSNLNVNNFIKNLRSFYQAKGTLNSFKVLISALFGEDSIIRNQADFLVQPSAANYRNRLTFVAEAISGDPLTLSGQTLFQDNAQTGTQSSAPISEVELIIRGGKSFYKVFLFTRFSDPSPGFEGSFAITPTTKAIKIHPVGSSVLSVDTTIGFPESGSIVSGNNVITYTDKSINQFLNCSGVTEQIGTADTIRTNDIAYAYSSIDESKVELRLTGVINDFENLTDIYYSDLNEVYRVRSVGRKIKNPISNKTFEQINFNSWVYNTSARIQIASFSGSTFVLAHDIDKAYLRNGDIVEVLNRANSDVVVESASVTVLSNNSIILSGSGVSSLIPSISYDIRRKIRTASSSGVELEYGNDVLISDVLNTYISKDSSEIYVASNSLPSYDVNIDVVKTSIPQATVSSGTIQDFNPLTDTYNTISFANEVPFLTGDEIVYSAGTATSPIEGLEFGKSYFVKVLTPANRIRLYVARSFIDIDDNIEINDSPSTGSHEFTLASQYNKNVSPQKLLKKFPLVKSRTDVSGSDTFPGSTGMLINGLEIINYKTQDKVYYGPLKEIAVINSGFGYDVINPPKLSISNPVSSGTTALANLAVRGSLRDILIDPQDFNITNVNEITISGGNGTGAVVEPIIEDYFREVSFSGKYTSDGGGVSDTLDTIITLTNHNFGSGEPIIYNPNGNNSIPIAAFGSTVITGNFLETGSVYYPEILTPTSFRLYDNLSDFNSGINTVGFTTGGILGGIHAFRLQSSTKRIIGVNVLNSGSGYESRNVAIQTTGISTVRNIFTFKNHGYSTGELVTYTSTGDPVDGLNTNNQYYIIKVDADNFRLSNAGVAGTITENFDRRLVQPITGIGTGYHIFNYPPIEVNVSVSIANTVGVITATPIVTGQIVDVLLYENGTSYGSDIINFEKKPILEVQNGSGAEFSFIISNGSIIKVNVTDGGSNYFSTPDLVVSSSSGGFGASLRAVVSNQEIVDVIIINGGANYSETDTTIRAVSRGSGSFLNTKVRDLSLNKRIRFEDYDGETLTGGNDSDSLEYGIIGYNDNLRTEFEDTNINAHSPLIGWAYDGNPIYGAYSYTDPNSSTSTIKRMESGYEIDTSLVIDRPAGFEAGLFVEDYAFKSSGDLDSSNGRFTKTPEFPNGTYAYFATLINDPITGDLVSSFPYFIGNQYRSSSIQENFRESSLAIDQDYDFNSNELIRNTFPYLVSEDNAGYDFYTEPYEIDNQRIVVNSTLSGQVSSVTVIESGSDYMVGDNINFEEQSTGGGASAEVFQVVGKNVQTIENNFLEYDNVTFSRASSTQIVGTISTYHDLSGGDYIYISGLSTFIPDLDGNKNIGVSNEQFVLLKNMPVEVSGGIVTDVKVSPIPQFLKVNGRISIGDAGNVEELTVLNVFKPRNVASKYTGIIRAIRGTTAVGHTAGVTVTANPSTFIIDLPGESFDSTPNEVVYFNPVESVGLGTIVGVSTEVSYTIAGFTTVRSIPTQSIYLENHPFTNNQRITIVKPSSKSALSISTVGGGTTFTLPESGNTQTVFVTNKGKNLIGIKTTLDSSEVFFDLPGDNDYQYYVESNNNVVTANIKRLTAKVSTASTHGLQRGDLVTFDVRPNLSVGIGTSTAIKVSFSESVQNILINPVGFTSSQVGLSSSKLLLPDHEFKTGDVVFYDASELPGGISTGKYFVYANDENSFSLAQTKSDITGTELNLISFTSIGGTSHTIAKVNPEIEVIKNNDLVFDTSDVSLSGYDFKIYYDANFTNELVGTGNSTSFEVVKTGIIGSGSTSSVKLTFNDSLPTRLYYNLERTEDGSTIEGDIQVSNNSNIVFIDSKFSGELPVVGVTSNTFTVGLSEIPERDSYTKSQCDVLEYNTKSLTAKGGIANVRMISNGSGYRTLPGISSISTVDGSDAILIANSTTIGKLGAFTIENPGLDFSVDKTLRPIADIPTYYELENSNRVSNITPVFGGRNYLSAPQLVLINSVTKEEIEDTGLIANLESGAITSVDIVSSPSGLSGVGHSLYTVSNSNGITILEVDSVNTGIVTVKITTPVLGFTTSPFSPGDKIFVEGIQRYGTDGDGFNSRDYGFQFFEVQSFNGGTVPATVTYDLSGITTNAGVAVTTVNFGAIVKQENYPTFDVTLLEDNFTLNETLLLDTGSFIFETDLIVTKSENGILKTFGDYELQVGDRIIGKVSRTKANIKSILRYDGLYSVDVGVNQDFGWTDNVGFLNVDYQVIPDNDYYQKLAYSIKSPIEFEDLVDPVNRLAHISGTKNFADTQVLSVGTALTSTVGDADQSLVIDILEEVDVTTINNFDFAVDTNVVFNSPGRTNTIKFGNKKLTNYIECITNRVLSIDDIGPEFVNADNLVGNFKDIINYPASTGYSRFIVLVTSVEDPTAYQVYEIVVLVDGNSNSFILEKSRIKSSGLLEIPDENERNSIGNLDSVYDQFGNIVSVRFTPTNINKTYDIKVFRQLFDSRPSGIGSFSIGDTELFGATTSCGAASTVSIVGLGVSDYNSLFAYVEITNTLTQERDYAEVSILHDDTDTYFAEYGFNTSDRLLSFNPIGTFGANLDSNILSLNYTNNTSNTVNVKAKIVGFQTTSVGVSSVHFKLQTQTEGSERTARLESNVVEETVVGYGITLLSLTSSIDRLAKSIVRVSIGNTQSLSQVLTTQDGNIGESFVVEYPQVGVNTAIGLGTFGSVYSANTLNLVYYPDSIYAGNQIRVEGFSEIIYKDQDTNVNSIPDFGYGTSIEEVVQSRYTPNDKLDFDINHKGYPIFARRFDPSNPTVFNPATGTIFLESHFLNTGQDVIYSPGSTIVGVNSESIGIGTTLAGGGSFVGDVFVGSKIISAASTTESIEIGQEVIGPGITAGSTIVSIGSSFIFFIGNTDGTNIITGVGNTAVLTLGDTIRELTTETGFGTITSIGINSITVDNNVPIGIGSTYYSETIGIAVSISQVSTANTSRQTYTTGISTDILPSNLFAIRVDNDTIKLATKKDFAISGIGITATSTGSGNNHLIDTTKKLQKSLIILDGVVQTPIARTRIAYDLQENIGTANTYFAVTGITSVNPFDIIRIDDEYMLINNIGIGTSNQGPITGIGTFNVVNVQRAYVGTTVDSHADGSRAFVYRGSYNIVESKVHFTDAPIGAGADFLLDERNLPYNRSDFSGRVYLRQDYTTNEIYDDISPEFTGIGKTFALTVDGQNPVGLETGSGSGVLFISGIHQGQSTDNNPSNVYSIEASGGGANVVFSGAKLIGDIPYISDTDPILNQLPNGGTIVSIASSGGVGVAPLVGAKVIATVGAGGSITGIVGFGSTGLTFGSGYFNTAEVSVYEEGHVGSAATISAVVGAGGSLTFSIVGPGTGYTNPTINVSDPSYSNLDIVGVSRVGVGSTTDTGKGVKVTLSVGAVSTVGIGSTLFEVKNFKLNSRGFSFKRGDVFKPVGVVTAVGVGTLATDFVLEVLDVYSDSFSSWNFGQIDYIDSIKSLQNGTRTRFPLNLNGNSLSFQKNTEDPRSALIDLDAVILIFVNGVIQIPKKDYTFEGGTSFNFSFNSPPRPEDDISIYFYRGTRDVDSRLVTVYEILKPGDRVQLQKFDPYDVLAQDFRTVFAIRNSEEIETNIYGGRGIDDQLFRPISLTKQKKDLIISQETYYKVRDSLETQVKPVAKIIKDFTSSDTEIFLDSADFFQYEENVAGSNIGEIVCDALIVDYTNPVSAAATAIVSAAGTISSIDLTSAGSGYPDGNVIISIAPPKQVDNEKYGIVGVGSTATASTTASGGSVQSPISIVAPGYGYTTSNPPLVIVEVPAAQTDNITDAGIILGYSGIITGIGTTTGTGGHPLALKFQVDLQNSGPVSLLPTLLEGYPISVTDTTLGFGVTSVNTSDSEIIGIGTTALDNIYYVNAYTIEGTTGIMTCNIKSDITGIGVTSGTDIGKFSWGKLSGFTRSTNPISITVSGKTVDVGLSTYPSITRNGVGLRNTGNLAKQVFL